MCVCARESVCVRERVCVCVRVLRACVSINVYIYIHMYIYVVHKSKKNISESSIFFDELFQLCVSERERVCV